MSRCGEAVPLGHYNGGNAEYTNNGEVDKSRLRRTIEGVVQPGHEGTHDEERDARVVKPEGQIKDSLDPFRNTICALILPLTDDQSALNDTVGHVSLLLLAVDCSGV